jgi:hypothetical protein
MTRGRNIGLGIDWNFPGQVGLISNRGEDLIHEIGMRCTCNNEDTHAGMIEQGGIVTRRRTTFCCPICRSDGYIYRNPNKICALITGIRQTKDRVEAGWAMPGDCSMSLKPGYMVSGGDLITFTTPLPLADGQVIVRGAGTADENSTRETGLAENEDRLWYYAHSPIWCEDEEGVVYDLGAFELDGSKIIRWLGSSPKPGRKYVIKYKAYFEWIAFMPPDIRLDRNRDLGSRVGLRKRHVAIINEDPGLRIGDRMPFCDKFKVC